MKIKIIYMYMIKKERNKKWNYVALAFGKSLNEVIGDMTKYRRHIAGVSPADEKLPTIFNEYMHLSWDSPTAENTAKYAPIVAKPAWNTM